MKWIWDCIIKVALLLLGISVVFLVGPSIESRLPIVDPFVVTEHKVVTGGLLISGWMYKHRQCELVQVYSKAVAPKRLVVVAPIQFLDSGYPPYSRPLGAQEWGPWSLTIPANATSVTITSEHRCHPFWISSTVLAEVDIKDL